VSKGFVYSIAALFVVVALADVVAQSSAQFRVTVTGIAVPVTVRASGKPALGLDATDFLLTDSGVAQDIVSIDPATLPLDLTVVAQETIRTGGFGYSTFEQEIAGVAAASRPGGKGTVRFVGRDQQALTPPLPPLRKDVAKVDRGCEPVYDTLARALLEPTAPDRQRVVVLVSVGEGGGNVLSTAPVTEIAQRSNARLYIVSVEPITNTTWRSYVSYAVCPESEVDYSRGRQDRLGQISQIGMPFDQWHQLWADGKNRLVKIAEQTGGREVRPTILKQSTAGPLRDVLDEVRGSYILRYTPKGVSETGWHPISVKVTKSDRYDIRARPGYQR